MYGLQSTETLHLATGRSAKVRHSVVDLLGTRRASRFQCTGRWSKVVWDLHIRDRQRVLQVGLHHLLVPRYLRAVGGGGRRRG